jgi:hypothetical protein
MSLEVAEYIIIPVAIFLLGALLAAVRGLVKFAQHLVRSEEAQVVTANATQQINEKLGEYMERTDARLNEHAQEIAVLKYAVQNGAAKGSYPHAQRSS